MTERFEKIHTNIRITVNLEIVKRHENELQGQRSYNFKLIINYNSRFY